MKPVTKWAAVCPATDRIPEYVAIAFRHALAPPRGPVYLELPADILFADGDAEPITFRAPARAFGDPAGIEAAAEPCFARPSGPRSSRGAASGGTTVPRHSGGSRRRRGCRCS